MAVISATTEMKLTHLLTDYPFKDAAQTALFKDPVRTAL
jgi:hypothetical protein